MLIYFQGEDFSASISRARFEEINAAAFKSTLDPVEKVLKDAKMPREKIDDIVLVGGSTRIPKIQSLVSEYFNGRQLNKSINPDEAVAYGAAVQAAVLTGQTSEKTADLLLLDVAPLSLGVAMQGDVFGVVVPRNTPIPTNKSRTFTTVEDNQTTVTFPVYVNLYGLLDLDTDISFSIATRESEPSAATTDFSESSSSTVSHPCPVARPSSSPPSRSTPTVCSRCPPWTVLPAARLPSVSFIFSTLVKVFL